MKQAIHPEYMKTTVHCNSCGITFESRSTVPEITVEICSNCHPFYTGKQKLLDTAGRVDKFNARRATATKLQAARAKTENKKADPELAQIETELESETVDTKTAAVPKTKTDKPANK
jgi:large subunit ribosomal protein L31